MFLLVVFVVGPTAYGPIQREEESSENMSRYFRSTNTFDLRILQFFLYSEGFANAKSDKWRCVDVRSNFDDIGRFVRNFISMIRYVKIEQIHSLF